MPEPLPLDNQLCFALYTASRTLTARYREMLDPHGLTYPQYLVLLALYEQSPITVKQLGDRLDLDSGTLSPLLKRMEAGGFVERQRNPSDERSLVVDLTDKSRTLKSQLGGMPVAAHETTGLTVESLVDLWQRLTEFNAALKKG